MNRIKFKQWIIENIITPKKVQRKWFCYFNDYHKNLLWKHTSCLPEDRQTVERIYFILRDYTEDNAKCTHCKEKFVNFNTTINEYKKFCSHKCASSSTEVQTKYIQTNMKKYGVKNGGASSIALEKRKKTNLEKYGTEYTTNLAVLKRKELHETKISESIENDNRKYEICMICKQKTYRITSHLTQNHKDISSKDYYDMFIKKENEGICPICKKETKFMKISAGYAAFCSKKCSTSTEGHRITKEKQKQTMKNNGIERPKSMLGKTHSEETKKKISLSQKRIAQDPSIKVKRAATCLQKYGKVAPIVNRNYLIEKEDVETYFSNLGYKFTFLENFKGKYTKAEITCAKGHTFSYSWFRYYRQKQNYEICLECLNKERLNKRIELIEKEGYKFLEEIITKNGNNKFRFICPNNHEHEMFYSNWFGGQRCGKCFEGGISKSELELQKFIEKTFKNKQIITNTKDIISPKELDIYLPNDNIAFEFNGVYWHSNKVLSNINYHREKFVSCAKKKIRLIQIWENDWIYRKEIVKSLILSKFQIYNEIIDSNECKIKEISLDTFNEFLIENHIEDTYFISEQSFGMFKETELVSSIGISNNYIKYCDKRFTLVNKSFECFINHINKKTLIHSINLNYFLPKDFPIASKRILINPIPIKMSLDGKILHNITNTSSDTVTCWNAGRIDLIYEK